MTRFSRKAATAGVLALAVAQPVLAHHRQTPPLVQITSSGDNSLPRVAPAGSAIVLSLGDPGAKTIVTAKERYPGVVGLTTVGPSGDNDNPVVDRNGVIAAWDTVPVSGTGRVIHQVRRLANVGNYVGFVDGTARMPAVDPGGSRLAWEEQIDDLWQVMYRDPAGIRQISQGLGNSHDPVVGNAGRLVAFDSTSSPDDGHDTQVAQIWTGNGRITSSGFSCLTCRLNGVADSRLPSLSQDSRALVFESAADLGSDGHDTGASQVYLYDVQTKNFARISNDPTGCHLPSVHRVIAQNVSDEYRVTYTCNGQAYFYDVRTDRLHHLLIDGDTDRIITAMDVHFFVLSTTAALDIGFGQTPGHQIYLWNEYKREQEFPSPIEDLTTPETKAVWFPSRGIPSVFK